MMLRSERESTAPGGAEDDYTALTGAVRELVKVMREGGIDRLKVVRGDLKIELSTRDERIVLPDGHLPATAPAPSVPDLRRVEEPDDTRAITSPMIGTFYAAAAPGERPFVEVGDTIEVGQTVAIIEAMKIMNEIVSEVAGTVAEILVRDGEPVEYGHPLMRVQPRA